MEVQEKRELTSKEEKTAPVRHFLPAADIYETDDALMVIVEVPGVEKERLDVRLENDVLRIGAQIEIGHYRGHEPVYTEYNVGHFERAFTLSSKIDQGGIKAELNDGVLTLTLPKSKEARSRTIPLS
jgi:HSP20 family molecular chaperone IbpA